MCVCVRARARVCVYVRPCVCACVCVYSELWHISRVSLAAFKTSDPQANSAIIMNKKMIHHAQIQIPSGLPMDVSKLHAFKMQNRNFSFSVSAVSVTRFSEMSLRCHHDQGM